MNKLSAKAQLLELKAQFGARLRLRVSLDDPRAAVHDAERGEGAYAKTLAGLRWLGRDEDSAGRGARGHHDDAQEQEPPRWGRDGPTRPSRPRVRERFGRTAAYEQPLVAPQFRHL